MPGIVGLITKLPAEQAQPTLGRMLSVMRHQPSYAIGTWVDEPLGLYVGWAERSNSFSDGTLLSNEGGDVKLAFSGEEFPEPGTVPSLKGHGYTQPEEGPSYLVRLYEEDQSFPACLNGRFHGLLADLRCGAVTLFNDRYGMHRLYFYQSEDIFYFAAEAKAILAVCPKLRSLDPRGLGEFISCGCVLENRTLFAGLGVLPPASAWLFRNGSLQQRKTYFQSSDWENQTPLEIKSYRQQIQEVFSRNLPRYFSGPERIGMSLTGGLDSRMIMAWQKVPPESLPCYSFGGIFRDCEDVILARRVAQACGQSHQVITVGEQFLANFPHYAERAVYLTDGCVDVSHAPDLYANERAAQIAPVRMTGNYGGEVLRRVRAFKPGNGISGLFAAELLSHVAQARETYARLSRVHPLTFAVFRQAPWHHYGLLALEQSQLSLRSPYLDNDFVRTVFRAPEEAFLDDSVCLALIEGGNPALRRMPTDRGPTADERGLAAAASRRLLKFTFKAEYAYDNGMPQWVARTDHLFSSLHLERLFLGRHKFYHFRVWYRDQLSQYVREMLLDDRTLSRPYLERQCLERLVRGHLKGDRNYTGAIHKVLTLELLHRLFLDSPSAMVSQDLPPAVFAER